VVEVADRQRLPNRRAHEVFTFEHAGIRYTVGLGRFGDSRLAEVFVDAGKAGSMIDAYARDGAVLISLLLQHGLDVADIKHSITRRSDGSAASALGALLDLLAGESR